MYFFFQIVNTSALLIEDLDQVKIYLRLTVPFGCRKEGLRCSLDLNMYIPQTNDDDCHLSSIAQETAGKFEKNQCGVRFDQDDFENNVLRELRVGTILGDTPYKTSMSFNLLLTTHKSVPHHEFFAGYKLQPYLVSSVLFNCILHFSFF